jgi:hypothetical protein
MHFIGERQAERSGMGHEMDGFPDIFTVTAVFPCKEMAFSRASCVVQANLHHGTVFAITERSRKKILVETEASNSG